jgi:hypothetical protein
MHKKLNVSSDASRNPGHSCLQEKQDEKMGNEDEWKKTQGWTMHMMGKPS